MDSGREGRKRDRLEGRLLRARGGTLALLRITFGNRRRHKNSPWKAAHFRTCHHEPDSRGRFWAKSWLFAGLAGHGRHSLNCR
jgi:hypothetical protein